MLTLSEIFKKYNCDKGKIPNEKGIAHHYYIEYEKEMSKRRNDPIKILEVGVWKGTSHSSWYEYFPNAEIYGIDVFTRVPVNDIPILEKERVHHIKGSSTSPKITDQVKEKWGDIKFDFIIDDGLHNPDANRLTFNHLIEYLADDGIFYIEDAWPIHIMTEKQMEHSWIKRNTNEYNILKMYDFMDAIKNYKVEEVDLRKISNRPDSYIFKVRK